MSAAGTSSLTGAEWSKPLPVSHGRPLALAAACRSRRVRSRPTRVAEHQRLRIAGSSSPGGASRPSATTSSTSWCRSLRAAADRARRRRCTTASAGLQKNTGVPRSAFDAGTAAPISARGRRSCGRRSRCGAPGNVPPPRTGMPARGAAARHDIASCARAGRAACRRRGIRRRPRDAIARDAACTRCFHRRSAARRRPASRRRRTRSTNTSTTSNARPSRPEHDAQPRMARLARREGVAEAVESKRMREGDHRRGVVTQCGSAGAASIRPRIAEACEDFVKP